MRHLQAESTQCWADNTRNQTLNICLCAALLYLGSFLPAVFRTLLPSVAIRISLPLMFGYSTVLIGAIVAYSKYEHASSTRVRSTRVRSVHTNVQEVCLLSAQY